MAKPNKKETMQIMLNDVVEHFGSNPKELRSVGEFSCKYHPPKEKPLSSGCAIGMYLNDKICKKLDGLDKSSITVIFSKKYVKNLLPKWMQKVDVEFLQALQSLHDSKSNWYDNGLSQSGKIDVEYIKKKFDL